MMSSKPAFPHRYKHENSIVNDYHALFTTSWALSYAGCALNLDDGTYLVSIRFTLTWTCKSQLTWTRCHLFFSELRTILRVNVDTHLATGIKDTSWMALRILDGVSKQTRVFRGTHEFRWVLRGGTEWTDVWFSLLSGLEALQPLRRCVCHGATSPTTKNVRCGCSCRGGHAHDPRCVIEAYVAPVCVCSALLPTKLTDAIMTLRNELSGSFNKWSFDLLFVFHLSGTANP